MKTKIIYISGSDVFEMADIRAAFSEVRNTLGLKSDTVLFGVPVDAEDIGISTENIEAEYPDAIIAKDDSQYADIEPIADTPSITEITPVFGDTDEEVMDLEPAPAPTPKKANKRVARAKTADKKTAEDDAADTKPASDIGDTEKVIPILSVLSSKAEEVEAEPNTAPVADIYLETEIDTEIEIQTETLPVVEAVDDTESIIESKDDNEHLVEAVDDTESIIESKDDNEHLVAAVDDTESIIESKDDDEYLVESVIIDRVTISDDDDDVADDAMDHDITITNMITDDAPVVEQEETLEQLLEKMTPLREDQITDDLDSDAASMEMESDATLAQLASEFVEKQDEIVSAPKAETSGKIGKLKNILPFKKAKREDAGLMGDLFGWAGIAANDDEFSIPGFFTTTASKK